MPKLPAEVTGLRLQAERGRDKQATWGRDLDLEGYETALTGGGAPSGCREALLKAGIAPDGAGRAGSYLQADRDVVRRSVASPWRDKVEILPVAEALAIRPALADLWWKAVEPGADKYTARVALQEPEGCYLGIAPGARIEEPLQACFLMRSSGTLQCVHNVIVAGEGAAAHVITGCTSLPSAREGVHIGVTECVVRRGASLTFTMIHNWGGGFHVRPRSVTVVEEGGTFVSNYVLMEPLGSLQMFPAAFLRGHGARCRFQSLVVGRGMSEIDIGSRVVHQGADTGSEIVSRAIASDQSSITARGRIEAATNHCRGHLECLGMIRSPEASITAVPELDVQGAPHADLSHEAAISPIAEEEVSYLMTRGLAREEAVATITRGFLDVDLLGLPAPLKKAVDEILCSL